jgi:alpha-2-macroglobulin-like protein
VALTTREGEQASRTFSFNAQPGKEHVLVRSDKSLYSLGKNVKVQVLATRGEGRAYLDWLNDGQIVDMRTLSLKDGVASLEVALDDTLAGENRIEAYVVDDAGNVVRAGRTIVVSREGGLRVALSQDKSEYRPGEAAKLTLSVTDEQGKPAPCKSCSTGYGRRCQFGPQMVAVKSICTISRSSGRRAHPPRWW